MKKLLFSVIAFALITTSCNKYKDDFAALNARLDALAAQVAGVATLQTGLTALTAQVTSLQTAVAGLPTTASITALQTGLTAIGTQVGTISTNLTALATAVAAGNTSLSNLITTLTTNVANNQTALTAALAAINSLIGTNQTALLAQLAAIQATQTAQSADLATIISQNAALTALVNALTTNLAIANLNIAILLANSQFYEGTLFIFDEATLAFAETLLNRIALIKGNVTVLTAGLDAGQKTRLDVVAGKMISIIGDFTYTGAGTTFGQLASISGNVTVSATANVNVPALKNVGGNYTVSGFDITDTALTSVAGNVSLSYANGYSSASLTSITGTFTLTDNATTTSVSFPNLTSAGVINGGTPVFAQATTVDIGAGSITSLTADKATSLRLGQARYAAGLAVSTSLTAAAAINLSATDSTTGALSITSFAASTVDLSNYRNGAGGGLTVAGPSTLTLPKYSYGTISSGTVKTLVATVYRVSSTKVGAATTFAGLTILENLTDGAAEYPIEPGGIATTLKTINVTAAGVASTLMLGGTFTAVTSVTVAGNFSNVGTANTAGDFGGVSLSGLTALTSLTTSGVINSFYLNGCTATGFTSVSLSHTHKVGGPGSYVTITGNTKLTGLTTSTDFATSLIITGNTAMAAIDLASYVNTVLGGTITVTVSGNKTTGTYTPTVVGTATTARVDPKYTASSPYMSQMKAYLSKFTNVTATPSTAATVIYSLNIDDVDPTAGVQTLSAAMTADAAGITASNAFNTTNYVYAALPALPAVPPSTNLGPTTIVDSPTELIKFQ